MGSETRARLALGGLLAATLLSFELLFEGDGYVGPALLAGALAMTISGVSRRWGAGPILSFELSLAGLFWYLALVFQTSETFYGLPTPSSATGLTTLMSSAIDASVVDYAPVPVRAGYVIMIVAGMWLATTIGEIAAFRWRRPVIASLPCLALFAMSMIVGTGVGTLFFLVVFLIGLLTFWASESAHRLRSWGRWVSTWDHQKAAEPRQVTSNLARRMGASCIAVTLVAPVFLPTLGEGWLPWRNDTGEGPGSGGGSGGNVNLLVDIAPKLLEQTDTQLFTVEAEEAAYWRLASLVEFDGRLWHEDEEAQQFSSEGRLLSPPDPDARTLTQTYDITNLEGRYLPAAVQPLRLDGPAAMVDPESVDLALDEGDEIQDSSEYSVTSFIPDPTYKELNEAKVARPPSGEYVDTGVPVSAEVDALLEEWIKGAETDFEQLLAIQNRLRGGEFTYRTDLEETDSQDYLADFLLESKAGFCQQFSTAFALLARRLGYPTRVSVGFLPGSAEATEDSTLFTVRGTDAHAWPEVKFEEHGWVAFEPTARALSSLPEYTVSPEAPDVFREGETGTAPAGGGPAPDDPDARGRNAEGPQGALPDQATTPAPIEEPAWQAAFLRLALVLLVGMLTWAMIVPLLKKERTKRRFRRARTPADVTIAAYMQFEDDASEMFMPRSPAESAAAYARRIGEEAHRVPPRPAERLAKLYEAAAYSPSGVTDKQALEARRVARELASALWSRSTPLQKAGRLFSVRSFVAGAGPRLRSPRARAATS